MNYKNLFLRQSYLDSYDMYNNSLKDQARRPAVWDYVIITASNEGQAESYRRQLDYRLDANALPKSTHYAVLSDPEGKRVGSGGATLNVLRYVMQHAGTLDGLRILCIHSGGDSKRVPQYSACGKLFSPVPRELPDGRRSTLFDELIISMSGVAPRIESGMLTLSGDILLLFNHLQTDFFGQGATALSINETAETGKNHGVFLRDDDGNVGQFLHKQPCEILQQKGAVDKSGKINIDTGAVFFDSNILNGLYSLIDTSEKFKNYVNDTVRLSFYADFLYPLASDSTLEEFYTQKPEGELNEELHEARTALWELLHRYKMKLICLSPASFLHFGTSAEFLSLVTEQIEEYKFLDWSGRVNTNSTDTEFAAYNSYIGRNVAIGKGSYIENSCISDGASVGKGCIISGVTLKNVTVPDNTLLHGLKLGNGKFVVRMTAISDNPKNDSWFGNKLDTPLWVAPLFGAFDSPCEAAEKTLAGIKGEYSLESSFHAADVAEILPWFDRLDDRIKAEKLLSAIETLTPAESLKDLKLTARSIKYLTECAENADFSKKMRIYYYISKITGDEESLIKCFASIREQILSKTLKDMSYKPSYRIVKDKVITRLPVRVNWSGTWSDTPPYCLEHGGRMVNAAVTLGGELPVIVTVRKTDNNKITLASTDNGSYCEFDDIEKLQDCSNPADAFSLHKAVLIACGIIPYKENIAVSDICRALGGGIYINTQVQNIPKGSGLGTSSILAGACVKGIFKFLGAELPEDRLYNLVLCIEQIMSTGGGWQDQVGGLTPGIKIISTAPGTPQQICCQQIIIPDNAKQELKDRFRLIYTGQRRLARNLLREVVGKYIGAEPDSLQVLYEIQRNAVLMQFELEQGNIDGFCGLLNKQWEHTKRLDSGCTNTCIEQIFLSIDDLIDAKMICGAGGGGFLQVMLKRGVPTQRLQERLWDVFADSGVSVYDCEFYCL